MRRDAERRQSERSGCNDHTEQRPVRGRDLRGDPDRDRRNAGPDLGHQRPSNESYFSDEGLLTQSLTTWGWFYIIVGVIQIAVGWMVFVGSPLGYGLGMFLAFLAILINFMSVGGYPIWSVTLMVLNFFIIWALATHWGEV